MAILIPNLNLPKGCGYCLLCSDHYGISKCAIKSSIYIDSSHEYTRHPKCPLIELDNSDANKN